MLDFGASARPVALPAPSRVEIANFWFGPTAKGRVALASFAIVGGDPMSDASLGEQLALVALQSHRDWYERIKCEEQRPAESRSWARLVHRNLAVEGRESFNLIHGFAHRMMEAATTLGLSCSACSPYWAAYHSTLDVQSWPEGSAKSALCRAEIGWALGAGPPPPAYEPPRGRL